VLSSCTFGSVARGPHKSTSWRYTELVIDLQVEHWIMRGDISVSGNKDVDKSYLRMVAVKMDYDALLMSQEYVKKDRMTNEELILGALLAIRRVEEREPDKEASECIKNQFCHQIIRISPVGFRVALEQLTGLV
jgi:hypothetical protein